MSEPTIGSAQASTREADRKHNVLLLKHILDCTRDLASRLDGLVIKCGTNEAPSLRFLSYEANQLILQYALGVDPTGSDPAIIFNLAERTLALMDDCHKIFVGDDEAAEDYRRFSDLPAEELEGEFDAIAEMLTEAGHTPSRPKLKPDMPF